MDVRNVHLVKSDHPSVRSVRGSLTYPVRRGLLGEARDPNDNRWHSVLLNQSEYELYLRQFEEVVAHWLAASGFAVWQGAILNFKPVRYDQNHIQAHREIDFVLGDPENPSIFIELKTHVHTEGVRGPGRKQLERSMAIARTRWPLLNGYLCILHMGFVLGVSERNWTLSLDEIRAALNTSAAPNGNAVVLLPDTEALIAYGIESTLLPPTWIEDLRGAYQRDIDHAAEIRRIEQNPDRTWTFEDEPCRVTLSDLLSNIEKKPS